MELNMRKEQFSNAFLLAVAAVSGCSVSKPVPDIDTIDWTLSNRLPRRPKLDVQLKCTSDDRAAADPLPFEVKKKNYDDLILTNLIDPRILVVVVVPETIEEWLALSHTELSLRRCAYWISLAGLPPSENLATVTIHIPRAKRFTVEELTSLMQRIDRGEPL